ncbi:membrane-spanning [Lasallia pustulata]|uniref:Membrane-spanning n=1 Tax=Lasallia pustulata TaxID=136370 RepID=A0A1W5DCY3_9LECA|nr:membrane-spanning [Lasallia pustulata]
MSTSSGRKLGFLQDLILIAAANVSVYYLVRYAMARLEPEDKKEQAHRKSAAAAVLRRLDGPEIDGEHKIGDASNHRTRKEDLELNQYEQMIAMEVVAPEDIPVSFDDIGGLNKIIEELKESVIYPLTMPHLYAHSSSLLSAPSGVLLYGPPGCGKTMLAKALANESGATFINLHISTLTEKWYGDSNKLVNAVFSLARKLQPTIVFIDEIDAVLGTRRSGEHEASGMVKAEFMTHWDGLSSANASGEPQRILILGATNRIQDIDEAILRRMPKKFPVSLPSASQRLRILGLVLKDTKIDKAHFDLEYLVRVMAGMSGSDIKEACRDAAMVPVREFIRAKKASGARMDTVNPEDVRGLRTGDFFGSAGGTQVVGEKTNAKTKKSDSEGSEVSENEETEGTEESMD